MYSVTIGEQIENCADRSKAIDMAKSESREQHATAIVEDRSQTERYVYRFGHLQSYVMSTRSGGR